jgi:hypothetical protein
MQPSNQLKGLVESYNSVYANRQELEEAKVVAESVINSVGVYMVEQGYTESDVSDFFKTSSIAKIDDVFEESLHSQTVYSHLNESLLFETHLRYIPGAMATRMKNESPELVNQLSQQIVEFIKLQGGKTGEKAGRGIRRFVGGAAKDAINLGKGAVDVAGAGLQGLAGQKTTSKNPLARAQNALGRGVTAPARTTAGFLGGVARGLMGSGSKSKSKPAVKTGSDTKAQGSGSSDSGSSGSGSGSSGGSSRPAVAAKPAKPALSAKDTASNAKYASLRKSDPAAAKKFGMAASKAKFGSNKPKTANPLMSSPASKAPSGRSAIKSSRLSAALDGVKKVKKESSELDLVLQHLVSEGIADSLQGALVMVEGMSDEFINSIIEQAQMGSAMVEFLIQNGEAETIEEAQYIISQLDEENIDLLIQSITEGPALQNTIKTLETKRDTMDKMRPGSSNSGKGQSVGAALYKAYQRGKV